MVETGSCCDSCPHYGILTVGMVSLRIINSVAALTPTFRDRRRGNGVSSECGSLALDCERMRAVPSYSSGTLA